MTGFGPLCGRMRVTAEWPRSERVVHNAPEVGQGRLATRLQQPDPQNPGQFIPLTRGKIAIEIEYAEIWFRRIEVKAI